MRFFLLALLLTSAPIAAAQEATSDERTGLVFRTDAPTGYTYAPASSNAEGHAPPLAVVFLGAAVGYGLGTAGGYGLGLATDRSFIPENIISEHGLVGAWIGGSTASALGAHLANGRRGSLWLNVLATTAAQGLYTYAVMQTPLADPLILGIPLVGVATSVAVERVTSR
jgi:hypothetical protein